jgi:hypothetical protein
MIVLKATDEILELLTSSSADIDYSISYVDVTTSTYTPSSGEGKITTATTSTILPAPSAYVQRQVKLITIKNRHASASNNVTLKKDVAGTEYYLTPTITLLAGEVFFYMDGSGWIYYSATGSIKAQQTAAGGNKEIQHNNNGLLAGDPDFIYDSSSKTLSLLGTGTEEIMKAVNTDPSSPSTDTLSRYTGKLSGRVMPKFLAPQGVANFVQPGLFQNNVVMWQPASSGVQNGLAIGTIVTTAGNGANVLPASTNIYTSMKRCTYANIVTTQNQQVGIRTEQLFWRGNAAGLGGFFFACRFGFTSIKTGCRVFVGMASTGAATVTVDPSGLINILGFGVDLADTAFSFMHNDSTGTAVKEAISGQGTLATNNTAYDAYIWCAPNDSIVYYRLDRCDTGAILCDTSVNSELPTSTTFLQAMCIMSNGTANVVAGDATIGINKLYIETER